MTGLYVLCASDGVARWAIIGHLRVGIPASSKSIAIGSISEKRPPKRARHPDHRGLIDGLDTRAKVMADWTPMLLGPEFWLDFSQGAAMTLDGSLISQINDLSGHARHASQSDTARPALSVAAQNGLSMGLFNGSSAHMVLSSSLPVTTDMTIFSVFGRASSNISSCMLGRTDSLLRTSLFWSVNNTRTSGLTSASALTTHGSNSSATGVFINSLRRSSSDIQMWANGADIGGALSAPVLTTASFTHVGRRSGDHHNGTLGEILTFKSALSQNERQQVEGYLAKKWGLLNSLPNEHPFKPAPPTAYAISGTTRDANNNPAQRTVRAYLEATGSLVGSAVSTPETGAYEIVVASNAVHMVVALGEPERSALVHSGVIPV